MSNLCEWQTLFEHCQEDATTRVDFRAWGARYYCDLHFCEMKVDKKSKWVKSVSSV